MGKYRAWDMPPGLGFREQGCPASTQTLTSFAHRMQMETVAQMVVDVVGMVVWG